MTRPALPVVFTKRAERHLEAAVSWWKENRPAASGAVADEVRKAIDLISIHPATGVPAQSARLRGVRRILLDRIGYYCYYRPRPLLKRIEVLALWHSKRGSQPGL